MKDHLLAMLSRLRAYSYTDKDVLDAFEARILRGPPYTRDEGADDHLCTFLIPVYMPERLIYLGHHIKAGSWIPPGGHIDRGETPEQSVVREMNEELSCHITPDQIELVAASIIPIDRPGPCKIHYDFWHIVHTPRTEFPFVRKEFHDARWFPIEEAVTQVTHDVYRPIMERLMRELF